ncbi:hypothetical protein BZG01_17805 [Labilibaculum manganireducens]|uniref:MobA/VirD2-like nuclease domain-containing protein n=1 Tax=Labilibaculum manganireducens TaxID=1940525 RepID=A0A2N3HVT6_9BACT|nr:relaxase/mobilization nuclease domain-containing protein [Labilibaculum manganireducens]PKQ62174.1 hypothetical protein BZG01_17805 [Labilibaculum manganireducens]
MVIVIHQTASTDNAFLYNEKKVEEKHATFFHSRNTKAINPFLYDKKHRLKEFTDIEKLNPRVKNKCLHISFNPSTDDYLKLGDKIIREEMDKLMQHMGYGNQPYFIYKHKDLDRVHFHIVSSRIDRHTGKKIKDNHERQKVQNFIKELELRHQLDNKNMIEKAVFKFSARSRNIKQSLEHLFYHLNQLDMLQSKEQYEQYLKLFNVEIRKSGRGHIVVVTDGNGKVIRYPIRLSKFKEQPKFYQKQKEKVDKNEHISEERKLRKAGFKTDFLKELLWQIRKRDQNQELKKEYRVRSKRKKKR